MTKRFMVDDCGTLIDMNNRNTYDYVSDVCEILNDFNDENERLKQQLSYIEYRFTEYRIKVGDKE